MVDTVSTPDLILLNALPTSNEFHDGKHKNQHI